MHRQNGYGPSRSSRPWSWVRRWVLASILWISLAWGLALSAYSETLQASAPDWPELTKSLDEINSGLQMIESSSSEIETLQAQREQRLIAREKSIDERDLLLQQRETRSAERERLLSIRAQGLAASELDLRARASLYSGMQADLDEADIDLKKAKGWGIACVILAALVGAGGGFLFGRL